MDKGMDVLGARATLERGVPGKGGKQGPVLKAAGEMGSGGKGEVTGGSTSLLFPALEVMQDVADDIILGVFVNVFDVRGQTLSFDLVLFGVIRLVIIKTGHLGILSTAIPVAA